MIISRTPFRVSFFGGGTDYRAWFQEHGGAVIGTAIDRYCYLTIRKLPPFFEHRHRIVYSEIELVKETNEIQHPVVRGVLGMLEPTGGLEIHHDADLPARSGLGSSSSFTVGLLHALKALEGRMIGKRQLSDAAIHVEQDVLMENVGNQDQIWAAFGGFNRIDFRPDGSYSVNPIVISHERRKTLQDSMMLVFTGFSRYASDIAKDQIGRFKENRRQLSIMMEMVNHAFDLLSGDKNPIPEFGRLLRDSWKLKRELANTVSTPEIDELFEAGLSCGAYGGKLLGAGGGGFLLFVAEPEVQKKIRSKLNNHIHISIGFDTTGSAIVVYEPDDFNAF